MIINDGGGRNPTLLKLLAGLPAPAQLIPSAQLDIPGDAKEALAFALLTYETWHSRPSTLPSVTGASRLVILGQLTPGNS